MRDALKASGRPILFSMCEWGTAKPWLWAQDVGNLWRTTGDIGDLWAGKKRWPDGGCCALGVLDILDLQAGLDSFAGPGHWNDPDMLEVGNGGMTAAEYRAHFSLWCLLAAPLIAGNDLRSMTPEIKEILTNKEVIAVNQDPLGREAKRVWQQGDLEIWSKPMQDGSRAVLFLNRGLGVSEITAPWTALSYPDHLTASVRDLWAHQDLGKFMGKFSAKVEPHSVVVITVKP
jgi:alpha-galactosidase